MSPRFLLPNVREAGRSVLCLAVYDWQQPVGREWLIVVNALFEVARSSPSHAVANFGHNTSAGSFPRVRSRIADWVATARQEGHALSVKITGPRSERAEPFFESDVEVVLNTDPMRQSALAAIAIDTLPDTSAALAQIESILFKALGTAYGSAFEMPAIFGPASYLSSVVAQPSGYTFEDLRLYADRVTRWRDRLSEGYRPSLGYMREVYPVSYLLPVHLAQLVAGISLGEFSAATGQLRLVPGFGELYRWDIGSSELDGVQSEMEHTGLILSSPTAPLRRAELRSM